MLALDLLDDPAAVHLESEFDRLPSNHGQEKFSMLRGAMLEELLDHVVPEDVNHEIVCVGQDLVENHLLLRNARDLDKASNT